MDRIERIDNAAEDLYKSLNRLRNEWDLTYAEIVGIVEMYKLDLWHETKEDDE